MRFIIENLGEDFNIDLPLNDQSRSSFFIVDSFDLPLNDPNISSLERFIDIYKENTEYSEIGVAMLESVLKEIPIDLSLLENGLKISNKSKTIKHHVPSPCEIGYYFLNDYFHFFNLLESDHDSQPSFYNKPSWPVIQVHELLKEFYHYELEKSCNDIYSNNVFFAKATKIEMHDFFGRREKKILNKLVEGRSVKTRRIPYITSTLRIWHPTSDGFLEMKYKRKELKIKFYYSLDGEPAFINCEANVSFIKRRPPLFL